MTRSDLLSRKQRFHKIQKLQDPGSSSLFETLPYQQHSLPYTIHKNSHYLFTTMGKKSKKGQTHHAPHAHHKAGQGTHGHHQLHNGAWYNQHHRHDEKARDSEDFVVHDNSVGVFMLGDFDETQEELIESPHQSFDHPNTSMDASSAKDSTNIMDEKKEPDSPTITDGSLTESNDEHPTGTTAAGVAVAATEEVGSDSRDSEENEAETLPKPEKQPAELAEPDNVEELINETENQPSDPVDLQEADEIQETEEKPEIVDSDPPLVESNEASTQEDLDVDVLLENTVAAESPTTADNSAKIITKSTDVPDESSLPKNDEKEAAVVSSSIDKEEDTVQPEPKDDTDVQKLDEHAIDIADADNYQNESDQGIASASVLPAKVAENSSDEFNNSELLAVQEASSPSRLTADDKDDQEDQAPMMSTPQSTKKEIVMENEEPPFVAEASPVPYSETIVFETPPKEDDDLLDELLNDSTPPILAKTVAPVVTKDQPTKQSTASKPSSKMTRPASSRVSSLSHHASQRKTGPSSNRTPGKPNNLKKQSTGPSPKPASTSRPRTTTFKPFNLSSSNHSKSSRKSNATSSYRSPHRPDHLGAFYGRHTKARADVWEIRSPTATPEKDEPAFVFHARPVPKTTYTPPRQKLYQKKGLSPTPSSTSNYQFKARPLPKSYRRGGDGDSIASSRK